MPKIHQNRLILVNLTELFSPIYNTAMLPFAELERSKLEIKGFVLPVYFIFGKIEFFNNCTDLAPEIWLESRFLLTFSTCRMTNKK